MEAKEDRPKCIGMIGGLGPESASTFYLEIVRGFRAAGREHKPIVLMWSVPSSLEEDTKLIENGEGHDKYRCYISEGIEQMEKAGAQLITIPCNTVHKSIKELRDRHSIQILSIVEETIRYLKEHHITNVVILATRETIRSQLYTQAFDKEGIKYVVPDEVAQEKINCVITRTLEGKQMPENIKTLRTMILAYKRQGFDPLLACTDLQLLLKDWGSATVHDTVKILAKATIREALNSSNTSSELREDLIAREPARLDSNLTLSDPYEWLAKHAKIPLEKAVKLCEVMIEMSSAIQCPPNGTGLFYCASEDALFRDQMCQLHGLYAILKHLDPSPIEPRKIDILLKAVHQICAAPCTKRIGEVFIAMCSDFRFLLAVLQKTFIPLEQGTMKSKELKQSTPSVFIQKNLHKLLIRIQPCLLQWYLMNMYTDLFSCAKKLGLEHVRDLYELSDPLKVFQRSSYPVMRFFDSMLFTFQVIDALKIPIQLIMTAFKRNQVVDYLTTFSTMYHPESLSKFHGHRLIFHGYQYRYDGKFQSDYATYASPDYELLKKLTLGLMCLLQPFQDISCVPNLRESESVYYAFAKEKNIQMVWDKNGAWVEQDVPFSVRHIFAASEMEAAQFVENNRTILQFSTMERVVQAEFSLGINPQL